MVKIITLIGNAETVGYAVDNIKDKKIRYELEGAKDSFRLEEYEVLSVNLRPSKKDPYQAIGKVEVKGASLDLLVLTGILTKMYSTLKIKG